MPTLPSQTPTRHSPAPASSPSAWQHMAGSFLPKQVLPRRSFGPTLPLNFLIDRPGVTRRQRIPTVANELPTAVEDTAALTGAGEEKAGILANYSQPPSVPTMCIVSLTSLLWCKQKCPRFSHCHMVLTRHCREDGHVRGSWR